MTAGRSQECATADGRRGSSDPLVVVSNVTKSFRTSGRSEFVVLDGVDLAVASREFVSLIGPSGCGKTTLLRLIAGLEKPDSGKIMIDGTLIQRPSPRMAMVFQSPCLLPWADIVTNVAFGLKARGVARNERFAKALQLIQLVGLDGFESALPSQLSGGMQQRVGLARALAVGPKIQLMDEPFGSLDEITRRRMQDELLKLVSVQRVAALFVTHSVDEALILSDRIVVMASRPGRIIAEICVPLSRPRTREMERSDTFHKLRDELWARLEEWG